MLAQANAIPKVDGLTPMEVSTLVHEESSMLADEFLKKMSNEGKNIIYDFTCKNLQSAKMRMIPLEKQGYNIKDMQFVFVDIPIKIAEERTLSRYRNGLNKGMKLEKENKMNIGGRYLPKKVLYSNASNNDVYNSKNAEAIINVWNTYNKQGLPKPIVYDNSGNVFVNPQYEPEEQDFDEFIKRS